MKKAHLLKVGEYEFVFGSVKAASAAYELLEAAEFFGKRTWRGDNRIVEVSGGMIVETVNRDNLNLLTHEENTKLEAIKRYKDAINPNYYKDEPDKRQKQIDRCYKVLLDLGIDPETITIEKEED